jgi:hypothetical protein
VLLEGQQPLLDFRDREAAEAGLLPQLVEGFFVGAAAQRDVEVGGVHVVYSCDGHACAWLALVPQGGDGVMTAAPPGCATLAAAATGERGGRPHGFTRLSCGATKVRARPALGAQAAGVFR